MYSFIFEAVDDEGALECATRIIDEPIYIQMNDTIYTADTSGL